VISDYFQLVEKKTSEINIIADKHLPTNIVASYPPGLIDVIDEIEKLIY